MYAYNVYSPLIIANMYIYISHIYTYAHIHRYAYICIFVYKCMHTMYIFH